MEDPEVIIDPDGSELPPQDPQDPPQDEDPLLEPDTRFPESNPPVAPVVAADPDDDDDPLDPTASKAIKQMLAESETRLRQELGAPAQITQELQDKVEVDEYIRTNPDFGKYRTSMLNYLKHPAYKNIPVGSIAAIVSAKDQQAIGARKEREAQAQASATRSPGTPARPVAPGEKDWMSPSVSKEDFEAMKAQALGRGA